MKKGHNLQVIWLVHNKGVLVMKKCFYPTLISLFLLSVSAMSTAKVSIAVSRTVDCASTATAWVQDGYYEKCDCPNPNALPVCSKKSSSSYSGSIPSRLSTKQQIAIGIAGMLLNNLFSNIFNEMFNPPDSSPSPDNAYQEQLRIQEEEKRKKKTQEALDAWRDAQEKATRDALKKQEEDKLLGASLIGKMGGGITGGGGKLDPMWITQKPELQPIQLGGYSTSGLKPGDRLLCSSYFSTRAIEETRKGNYEGARFFNEQSEKVMAKAKTNVECKFPPMPDVPTPKTKAVQQMDPKKFTALMEGFNAKIKELQNVEVDLNKVRQEKQTAEENLKKIDEKITEINNQAQSAQNPEEKAQADELLQQAYAAKSEAENQINTATQNEQKLFDKTKNMAKDIDASLKSVQ